MKITIEWALWVGSLGRKLRVRRWGRHQRRFYSRYSRVGIIWTYTEIWKEGSSQWPRYIWNPGYLKPLSRPETPWMWHLLMCVSPVLSGDVSVVNGEMTPERTSYEQLQLPDQRVCSLAWRQRETDKEFRGKGYDPNLYFRNVSLSSAGHN